jgi:hypothetical protein
LSVKVSVPNLDWLQYVPKIIEEGAKSRNSIFVLLILVVVGLAYAFFVNEPARIKQRVWTAIFVGVVAYGTSITVNGLSAISVVQPVLPLPGSAVLRGVVFDTDPASGLEGATVSCGNASTKTHSDGSFSLSVDHPTIDDKREIVVTANGFGTHHEALGYPWLETSLRQIQLLPKR